MVQHKTRGFSCRKTSKEGHAEFFWVVLYVYAAHFLCVCLAVRNTTNFREPSGNLLHKFIQCIFLSNERKKENGMTKKSEGADDVYDEDEGGERVAP